MLAELARYHPVIIEGMGYYDPRPPAQVAATIVASLQSHWAAADSLSSSSSSSASSSISGEGSNATCAGTMNSKPKLLITQGDPLSERGISAITPLVSEMLDIQRGLVVLDEHIDPYHTVHAPRDNVIVEYKYSDMLRVLKEHHNNGGDGKNGEQTVNGSNGGNNPCIATKLEQTVDAYLDRKNAKRRQLDKPPLKSYFKDYAMLQEVTKAACKVVCDEITIAHTAHDISDFSVTSFYEVGIELGLLDLDRHYVPYGEVDELDFETIDKR